jgi:hypothetical protein
MNEGLEGKPGDLAGKVNAAGLDERGEWTSAMGEHFPIAPLRP